MTCVIVVPVLRRPHRVEPLLASIEKATPEDHRVLFVVTPGDVEELAAIAATNAEWIATPEPFPSGDYARKINLAYRASWEPLMFLAADDLHPHPGWLTNATKHLTAGIGVVGTNDLGNARVMRGDHATHSLVTREYVDRHGTIDEPHKVLHDGYFHNFVDDELIGTAKHRDAFAFADDSHVEHLHPNWGKAPRDEVYDHGNARFDRDRRLFHRRLQLWT